MKSGVLPIGSRRRRAAVKSSDNIPFEQLPYQCFQEARKVLAADREEKILEIQKERLRISNLMAQDASNIKGGEQRKQTRLDSMRRYLEYLKIQADINDPMIKKRFEDGEGLHTSLYLECLLINILGDMTKPIYRYLADRKWRKFQRLVIMQRIEQLAIVPDILPVFEPTAEVKVAFSRRNVHPGEFIDSRVSEIPARLNVQVFDKGERLVSVIVIDSDVPDLRNDQFKTRCHYFATNIPLSPANTSLPLSHAKEIILPWLPPFAQKGSPYHRYSIFVLQQDPTRPVDFAKLKEEFLKKRDGFKLRGFINRFNAQPIGVGIFRSMWDEGTAGVMQRANIEGADIEFKRRKIEALKPKQKARGWEARHAGPKYASLRKGRGTMRPRNKR